MLSLNPRPLHFLLLGGDEELAERIRLALSSNLSLSRLERVASDDEAFQRVQPAESPRQPQIDLLFLDLDTLGRSGLAFLQQIKQHEHLCVIPVVVLSSSATPLERDSVYTSGANSFVLKPGDSDRLRQMLQDITSYWALWNQPPVPA